MHPFHFCVVITFDKVMEWWNTKVGGLNSRDQSRSRSRMSFVSWPTFENRRECPSCRDQLFFSKLRFLKSRLLQPRLGCVETFIEIIETNQDHQDKLRFPWFFEIIEIFVETFQDLSRFLDIFERVLLVDNCGRSHPSTDVY
jgi:hypothetical protein